MPVRGGGGGSAAAAARFYQHNRHGSNTSLDSQQHYIDHRNQSHSLRLARSPGAARSTGARFGQTPMRSPTAFRGGPIEAADLEEAAVADENLAAHADDMTGELRQPRGSSSSRRRYAVDRAAHDQDREIPRGSPHTASRRTSMLEDDVCFPVSTAGGEEGIEMMHQDEYDGDQRDYSEAGARHLPPGFPFTFDLAALEDFAAEERDRIGSGQSWPVQGGDIGLRNRVTKDRTSQAYGISPDSDDATFYSRRPRKFSPSAGPVGSSRYQRKLALFEGAGSAPPPVGNIMGNGALLQADQGAKMIPPRSSDVKTPLLDKIATSAPGGGRLPSYHGTWNSSQSPGGDRHPLLRSHSHGANHARGGSHGAALSMHDKPYRFTFYSNALPSTIHARHLAELPAAGQTFEELFSGHTPGSDHEGDGSGTAPGTEAGRDSRPPTAAPSSARVPTAAQFTNLGRTEGDTAPATGTTTPVNGHDSGVKASGITAAKMTMQAPMSGRALPGGGIRMDQDPEANTWWLDVLSPTDQEMKLLSRAFGIHPLTTEDILMEETREKIELFRNYYLVCFRSFDQDPYSPTYLEPLNMYIIVFREGTLSFHFRATPHPQNVRRRIKQLKDYINVTSDWISYALIDDITDAFGPLIQSIEYEVDSIDELVLILKEAEQSDMLRRIGTCRKKVMGLLRLMGNKADVVKGLAKRCNENWSVAPKSDIGLYLSDIQDHLITMTQNLNHYEKILSRSHSNYLAQISIEMTDANNQINDVLSKLTALGTVIVPMNVITGLVSRVLSTISHPPFFPPLSLAIADTTSPPSLASPRNSGV